MGACIHLYIPGLNYFFSFQSSFFSFVHAFEQKKLWDESVYPNDIFSTIVLNTTLFLDQDCGVFYRRQRQQLLSMGHGQGHCIQQT
jgi:hypothetical protein